ncbi:unnamed protein product [Microthlaspi erraticum]|uniref:Uncharacterized protein n=1 Tax=Microthlaspi erraticum TaxID=1685480 RepID=A0A6D2IBQ2_9BRAS|nr:unnamed protein product [Microthlaspi erraticum]
MDYVLSFVSEASTLWNNLQSRFSVGNGVRKQVLKDEIALCKQNGQPILDQIRSTITGEDPLPSLNQVYSRVIREEQNLNISRASETSKTDAIGFAARGDSSAQFAAVSAPRSRDRSTLSCTHCNRQGHEVSECFLLHGYPDWYYELNKGAGRTSNSDSKASVQRGGRPPASRGRGRGRANNAHVVPEQSHDQIAQLISLLQAQRPNTTSEKLSGKTLLTDVIIDTSASHHMTGDISILQDVFDILPSAVKFPDGSGSRATKRGTLALSSDYLLPDVLFVPDFDCTLISVSKLLKQTGCIAIFTDTLCFLQDRFMRTLIGAGEEREGVYYFTGVLAARVNNVSKDTDSSGALLHRRLGHPSAGVLNSLPNCDRSPSVLEEINSCDICFRAKQTREIFNDSINKASDCFALIHCDVWGPYRTPSSSGVVYFLTIVDDYSRSSHE